MLYFLLMESFNKVLSFVLGLVVVVVFVIVLSNRLNIKTKIIPLSNITVSKKITPTPVKKTTIKTQDTKKQTEQVEFTQPAATQETKGDLNNIKKIPETGSVTPLILIYSSSAILGFYLRRFKK